MIKTGDKLNIHCNVGKMWVHFEVMEIEEDCTLAVRITATGFETPICEFYSADMYAQAKNRFNEICEQMIMR